MSSARRPPRRLTVFGYNLRVLSLQAGGADAQRGDEVNHSFFEPVGRIVEVEGEYVRVFDFPD